MEEFNLSIHTFVDASKTAYAACIFLRSVSSRGSVTVQLLQARSRIIPMKTITIPRLELMAAVIGARLFSSMKQSLKLPYIKTYFWTDSSTVLTWWQGPAWLQNPKEQWPMSAVNIDEKEVEIEKRNLHWLLGRELELFPGKDGIIRLVKLRTEKGNVLRPIQRLYPLELKPNYEQVVSENWKVPEVVTEYPELNTDSNKTVPVTSSGREIKPVKRLDL
ncbi:uncharacterized protein NPIL_603191 [Nephila pilipes]|uniref:DUF5641 domain-containing protein n=1 Tax=Nephila pilipes TaxID=299642 RepID=A0A8X6QFG4_NEPPI|nr:uncharacterized protein NPIL_603191 [Nephila pilipes]